MTSTDDVTAAPELDGHVDTLVGNESRHDERVSLRALAVRMVKNGIDRRIHNCGLAIIVSADPARNMMRDSDIAVRAC